MADLFTTDAILLVEELKSCKMEALQNVPVIQRGVGRTVDGATEVEEDVLEFKGAGACAFFG